MLQQTDLPLSITLGNSIASSTSSCQIVSTHKDTKVNIDVVASLEHCPLDQMSSSLFALLYDFTAAFTPFLHKNIETTHLHYPAPPSHLHTSLSVTLFGAEWVMPPANRLSLHPSYAPGM
jgi:hypothetical protein